MAQFRVSAPDGAIYDVTAPEGATEQDAVARVRFRHLADQQGAAAQALEQPTMSNPLDQFDAAPRTHVFHSVQWSQHYRLLKASIVLALVPRLLSLLPEPRQPTP